MISTKRAPFLLSVLLLGSTACSIPVAVAAAPQKTTIGTAYSGAPVSAAVAEANKAELVARVKEINIGDIWPSRVVSELMTFKLSEEAWKVLLSDKGIKKAAGAARDINDYAMRIGLGDLEKLESANNAREANQGDVTEQIAKLKPLIAFHLEATQPKVSPTASNLILNAFSTVPEHMDRGVWKPAGGKADITLIMSPTASDSSVIINPAKTVFTITAPVKTEVPGWAIKIEKGLDRGK